MFWAGSCARSTVFQVWINSWSVGKLNPTSSPFLAGEFLNKGFHKTYKGDGRWGKMGVVGIENNTCKLLIPN